MAGSVIICTKNRPNVIIEYMDCIAQALTNAAALDAEIIVVDASVDNRTCAAVGEWAASCAFRMHLVRKAGGSFAAALSLGLQEAQGDWVIFTDGFTVKTIQRETRRTNQDVVPAPSPLLAANKLLFMGSPSGQAGNPEGL